MKVLVQIPLSPFSGYGNDGIGIVRALMRRGADVHLLPTAVQAPIPPDVAMLLTKETKGPFDLGIVHVDPVSLEAKTEHTDACDVLIGWTMWEWSNLRNAPMRSTARKRYKNFDALVGYDRVSSEGLAEYFKGPVITQQGGYEPKDWPYMERDWHSEDFYFCQIGVLSDRKNPFASIRAFADARNEDEEFAKHARLMLKTSVPGLHSKMEDIFEGLRIFYDAWPVETVRDFYRSSHVLLAPSRGEGKNMPALEMQSTGAPVIATNWGGHREWLHPDYAYPLDYTLVAQDAKYPDTLNAEVDVTHLKNLMLHTFHNREEAKRRGEIASQIIPAISSWDAVIERLFEKLADIPGGAELKMKSDIARRGATS